MINHFRLSTHNPGLKRHKSVPALPAVIEQHPQAARSLRNTCQSEVRTPHWVAESTTAIWTNKVSHESWVPGTESQTETPNTHRVTWQCCNYKAHSGRHAPFATAGRRCCACRSLRCICGSLHKQRGVLLQVSQQQLVLVLVPVPVPVPVLVLLLITTSTTTTASTTTTTQASTLVQDHAPGLRALGLRSGRVWSLWFNQGLRLKTVGAQKST